MRHTIRDWRGVVAEIRWHTYTAAAIRGYVLHRARSGVVTARATIVLSDAFKLAQRPLVFVMPVRLGKPPRQRDAEFCYPIETLTVRDGRLDATLGPRIRGTHAALPFRRPDPRSAITVVGR